MTTFRCSTVATVVGAVTLMTAHRLQRADAHLYQLYPPSRQLYPPDADTTWLKEECPAYGKGTVYCPAFMNAQGPESVKARSIANTAATVLAENGNGEWPLKWAPKADNGNYLESDEIAKRHGICGDPNTGAPDGGNWYSTTNGNWDGNLEAVEEGQVLEIKLGMNIYHLGHVEFFICNTDMMGSDDIPTQECFNKYPLTRAGEYGGESPIDPDYPGRYYVDPPCRGTADNTGETETDQTKPLGAMDDAYVITTRYQLPPDLTCEHCILQMVYYTGNTCNHEGYDEFDPSSWLSECAPTKEDWIKSDVSTCGESGTYPEEFWGCSDISIVPDGTASLSTATAKTCDGELDQSDCYDGSELYIGQYCNDCDVDECCGGPTCTSFDFDCANGVEQSVYCVYGGCTSTMCCLPATCQDATAATAQACLGGAITDLTKDCTICGPSECCDSLEADCEEVTVLTVAGTTPYSLPVENCVEGQGDGYQVTIPETSITVAPTDPWLLKGCYYTFNYSPRVTSDVGMTPTACGSFCYAVSGGPFQYMALRSGNICSCGAALPVAAGVDCDEPCSGDASLICGGTSYHVYEYVEAAYTLEITDGMSGVLVTDFELPLEEGGVVVDGVLSNDPATITVTGVDFNGPKCTTDVEFSPVCQCDPNMDNSDCPDEQVCCSETSACISTANPDYSVGACGDPHMSGFLGQKFDFTGDDGEWYALVSNLQNFQLNMRVTSPVPSLPQVTYITGVSVITTDADGVQHTIAIQVKKPHSLESSCPTGVSPCLADGSLDVVLDGKDRMFAPGSFILGTGIEITTANLPGSCRSFGFEKYWDRKQREAAGHSRRLELESMGSWILGDPTATNKEECTEYVKRAELEDGGVFAHQSEHASFKIMTPTAIIRLSHGRLHQIAARDPTGQYDLPDHLAWQMNVAIDQHDISTDASGILGETFVPTVDKDGNPIMSGMESIRGNEKDYRVEGPFGLDFAQKNYTP